nr:uncharacterized protein CTRU02_12185 [Colletotrichum truncatum]KAF6784974.1 hypothetical protein CTRU02_12185 [Colletotrichum truncatum]
MPSFSSKAPQFTFDHQSNMVSLTTVAGSGSQVDNPTSHIGASLPSETLLGAFQDGPLFHTADDGYLDAPKAA